MADVRINRYYNNIKNWIEITINGYINNNFKYLKFVKTSRGIKFSLGLDVHIYITENDLNNLFEKIKDIEFKYQSGYKYEKIKSDEILPTFKNDILSDEKFKEYIK